MSVAMPFCKPSDMNVPCTNEVGTYTCPTGATTGHMVTDREVVSSYRKEEEQ